MLQQGKALRVTMIYKQLPTHNNIRPMNKEIFNVSDIFHTYNTISCALGVETALYGTVNGIRPDIKSCFIIRDLCIFRRKNSLKTRSLTQNRST